MTEPRDLSLYAAAEQMRRGQLTAEALLRSCLERIEQREPQVRAWASLHVAEALELARRQDADAARQHWHGPLHGLPLGIKDIFDVRGMETRCGTEAYEPRTPDTDAASVTCLREAGAIVLGKTVTTAFAMADPGPTRNPWNPAHTPGGSSSGSGAAVADRMALGALGTQTAGSVIRPAAYNGVVGFKPGHGRIAIDGVLPLAWQLDHVGTLTRSVEDAHLLWHLMRDERRADPELEWQDRLDKLPSPLVPRKPARLWRLRGLFEDEAEPEMLAAFEQALKLLADKGVEIVERPLPPAFAGMLEAHRVMMAAEAATAHRERFATRGHLYPPGIRALVEEGQGISAVDYVAAVRHRAQLTGEITTDLTSVDAAVAPAATGPAPEGLEHTGSRLFNVLASFCGIPVVSMPFALSGQGLPVALQVMSLKGGEDELLALGGWAESVLGFDARPDAGA